MSSEKKWNETTNKFLKPFIILYSYLFDYIVKEPFKSILLFLTFICIPLVMYVNILNPYNILNHIPRLVLMISILLVYVLVISISFFTNEKIENNKIGKTMYSTLIFMAYMTIFVFGVSFFYYIAKNMLLYSNQKSIVITFFTFLFISCIYYKSFVKDKQVYDENENPPTIIEDILLYIPCLIVDLLDALVEDVKHMPHSTFIMIAILGIISLVYYILPLFQQWEKRQGDYIHLIDDATELNGEILHMDKETLKKRQIEHKPFFQRKLMEQTQLWEKQLKEATKPSILDQYNQYENSSVLYDKDKTNGTLEYTAVKDVMECKGRTVACEQPNNDVSFSHLVCVDPKDTYNKWKVVDYHGMYQPCSGESKSSIFSDSMRTVNAQDMLLKKTTTSEPITFKQFCNTESPDSGENIHCENIKELKDSNQIDNITKTTVDVDTFYQNDASYAYFCRNTNDTKKYIIHGYNDTQKNETIFKCPTPTTEGFVTMYNPKVHKLDDTIENVDLLDILSKKENEIIINAMEDDTSNFSNRLEKLTSKADIQHLYMEYLSNHNGYSAIMSNIHELNQTTNEYIQQETSTLIQMINRMNQIYDYNYHYGISFWVYFDPELLKAHSSENEGMIFNYTQNPYLYYHFANQELVAEVNNCTKDFTETQNTTCDTRIMYRSKDVLFQKWNHIVVNYDYGTLDLFINNNLVATKQNVSPYIQKDTNIIQFGSFVKPLTHAGICNARYYDRPLNLTQIKNLYGNKKRPCK